LRGSISAEAARRNDCLEFSEVEVADRVRPASCHSGVLPARSRGILNLSPASSGARNSGGSVMATPTITPTRGLVVVTAEESGDGRKDL